MWLLFASMERITTELQPNKKRIRSDLYRDRIPQKRIRDDQ